MSLQSRYTVLRKIADGGTAEIFLAKQKGAQGFEKMVVLKRIFTTFYADPQFRHMLVDEAHIAMSLYHSNIVQVLDLGEADGRYFLALELVDGWTLDEVLKRSKAAGVPFPPALALYVAAEVGRALAYAHSKDRDGAPLGIVHRDISPHNVLLSEHGEVKLTDFGIAKAQNKKEQSLGNIIKGKISFMSPEQASGGEIDARSDLFSLGTMLYVMVTRRYPFDAPTDYETLMQVKAGDFFPPETARPGLNPEIYRVIRKAMGRTPAERYQKANDMLVDVEQVMRVAFRAVGQTELARWLTDLSAKDGVPTLTRAPIPGDVATVVMGPDATARPSRPQMQVHVQGDVREDRQGDRGQESGVVLDLSDAEELPTIPNQGLPPPIPATEVSIPIPALRPQPFWGAPGVRRAVTRIGAVALLLLLGGFSVRALLRRGPAAPQAGPTESARRPTASPAPPAIAHGPAPGNAAATGAAAAPSAPKPAATTPTPGGDAAMAQAPPAPTPARAEPEAPRPVAAAASPAPAEQAQDNPTDEASDEEKSIKPDPKAAKEKIPVAIKSDPDGSRVSTRHHAFGATPLSLKLRPGNEYELTFEKAGYLPFTKVYRVTPQTRTIAVTLKRSKPAPVAAPHPAPAPPPPDGNTSPESKKAWWKPHFAR